MANPFDQFDTSSTATVKNSSERVNPFDQFDDGIQKPTAPSGIVQGLKDLPIGTAQLLTQFNESALPGRAIADKVMNSIGLGGVVEARKNVDNNVLNTINEHEANYQSQRAAAGEKGLDGDRLLTNIASFAIPGAGMQKAAQALKLAPAAQAATVGAGTSALMPTFGENFWQDKAISSVLGGTLGVVGQKVVGGLARMISPKSSVNPDLQVLKQEGVMPTIGQALGGMANSAEQKLQSLPFVGDAVRSLREGSRQTFQNATINKALQPIGGNVKGAGQEAVKDASAQVSQAYDDALNSLKGVRFDDKFRSEMSSLKGLAENLTGDMRVRFTNMMNRLVIDRMSKAPGMEARAFKATDSELGRIAAQYKGSASATEKEFGNAVLEAQRIMRDQVARQSPEYASALRDADKAFAAMTRVERAAAKNAETGEFTPKQLLQAVREGDRSVRKNATAKGDALFQDWAGAGSRVLSETLPNSGTADRLLPYVVGGASVLNPYVAVPTIAAARAAYTPAVQKALVSLFTARPDFAKPVAGKLIEASPLLAVPGASAASGMLKESF